MPWSASGALVGVGTAAVDVVMDVVMVMDVAIDVDVIMVVGRRLIPRPAPE
ncbi:hypothetical protein [Streptomyces sp. NPDC052496]|uniref:hypothetical protein n=1 Tax=Streptomyces sp. NPDC052496 TaxID=3154951 RepID=UPI0034171039